MRDKVSSGMRSSYSNMKDKAVAFAEASASAGFDRAQKPFGAKDPKEIDKICQDHRADRENDRAIFAKSEP
jgi:hypothetical protein